MKKGIAGRREGGGKRESIQLSLRSLLLLLLSSIHIHVLLLLVTSLSRFHSLLSSVSRVLGSLSRTESHPNRPPQTSSSVPNPPSHLPPPLPHRPPPSLPFPKSLSSPFLYRPLPPIVPSSSIALLPLLLSPRLASESVECWLFSSIRESVVLWTPSSSCLAPRSRSISRDPLRSRT